MLAGSYERARDALRQARRLFSGDPVACADLCLQQSRLADLEGSRSASTRWIKRGLRELGEIGGDPAGRERAILQAALAFAYRQQGRPRRAVEWGIEAIEHARRFNSKAALADACMVLDLAYFDLGQPELASNSETALPILEEIGEFGKIAILLNALGGFAYYQGRWSEARAYYERSDAAFERVGNVREGAFAKLNMAEILADQGHLDEAEALLRDILRLWRSLEFSYGVALATKHLGRVALKRNDPETALGLLQDVRETFAAYGVDTQVAEVDARIAECKLRAGEPQAALHAAEELIRAARASGSTGSLPMLHRIAAYARLMLGDVDGARADAEESVEIARARDDLYELSSSLETSMIVRLIADGSADGIVDERRAILDRLGIVGTPPPPVASGDGALASR
jgi:tetratricopeptide (TPR) repeat protein